MNGNVDKNKKLTKIKIDELKNMIGKRIYVDRYDVWLTIADVYVSLVSRKVVKVKTYDEYFGFDTFDENDLNEITFYK